MIPELVPSTCPVCDAQMIELNHRVGHVSGQPWETATYKCGGTYQFCANARNFRWLKPCSKSSVREKVKLIATVEVVVPANESAADAARRNKQILDAFGGHGHPFVSNNVDIVNIEWSQG